jgi:hypothetical protein
MTYSYSVSCDKCKIRSLDGRAYFTPDGDLTWRPSITPPKTKCDLCSDRPLNFAWGFSAYGQSTIN